MYVGKYWIKDYLMGSSYISNSFFLLLIAKVNFIAMNYSRFILRISLMLGRGWL